MDLLGKTLALLTAIGSCVLPPKFIGVVSISTRHHFVQAGSDLSVSVLDTGVGAGVGFGLSRTMYAFETYPLAGDEI